VHGVGYKFILEASQAAAEHFPRARSSPPV
jgi:hypothetical protein